MSFSASNVANPGEGEQVVRESIAVDALLSIFRQDGEGNEGINDDPGYGSGIDEQSAGLMHGLEEPAPIEPMSVDALLQRLDAVPNPVAPDPKAKEKRHNVDWGEREEEWHHNQMPFTGEHGWKERPDWLDDPDRVSTPADFFLLFISMEMLETIVEHTNRYARTVGKSTARAAGPPAWSRKWVELTVSELIKWITILILGGGFYSGPNKDWWSTNPLIRREFIPSLMTRDRFLAIKAALHFQNDDDVLERHVLRKIGSFLAAFLANCARWWQVKIHVSIDEMMLKFCGASLSTLHSNRPPTHLFKPPVSGPQTLTSKVSTWGRHHTP